MTKKKKRALEQARLEEESRQANRRPAMRYGAVNGQVLPVIDSSIRAVQLPPIIQPISLIPYISDLNLNINANQVSNKDEDDFVDDFDDGFDDMF